MPSGCVNLCVSLMTQNLLWLWIHLRNVQVHEFMPRSHMSHDVTRVAATQQSIRIFCLGTDTEERLTSAVLAPGYLLMTCPSRKVPLLLFAFIYDQIIQQNSDETLVILLCLGPTHIGDCWRVFTQRIQHASRCKAIMIGSRWSTNKLLFFSCKGLGGWNMLNGGIHNVPFFRASSKHVAGLISSGVCFDSHLGLFQRYHI